VYIWLHVILNQTVLLASAAHSSILGLFQKYLSKKILIDAVVEKILSFSVLTGMDISGSSPHTEHML